MNHPGTRWHETAFNLAHKAAAYAELTRLTKGYRIPDEIRQLATYSAFHLSGSRFVPTLDSPYNYLGYALQSERMPCEHWRQLQGSLEEAIQAAEHTLKCVPADPFAIHMRSGIVSMKARMLAVTGDADDLREADKLQKHSLRDLERMSLPYGYAYPVLKSIVQARLKDAIRWCQKAVEDCQRAGAKTSAAAFGALWFQLTDRMAMDRPPTRRFAALASEALASSIVRYKCSTFSMQQAPRHCCSNDRPLPFRQFIELRKHLDLHHHTEIRSTIFRVPVSVSGHTAW